MSVIVGDTPEIIDPSRPAFQGHSKSLELTRIDGYDFLLVIRSKHGPIS